MENTEQLITDNLELWTAAISTKSSAGRGARKKRKLFGINKLRELILELAVRGMLVPQDLNDEPSSELLKKIAQKKAKLVEEGHTKAEKPLPSIMPEAATPALPKGWKFCHLGSITLIVRGITFPASEKSKTPEKGRVGCLRTSNVQDRIEWTDLLFIREEFIKRKDQVVLEDDIVMSMANSRELVGKVAIVDKAPESKTTFGGFLGVIRPVLVNPYFVMILLRSPNARNELIGSASQTTNIANVSLGKLRPLILPLPPLAEQHRIVAKVDELMALCDQLEQEQESSLDTHDTLVATLLGALTTATADASQFAEAWQRIQANFDTLFTTESSIAQLKQTILQLAVMGKLVEQDSEDEPASELLRRIAAEKANLVKEKKIKKPKPLLRISSGREPYNAPETWEWCHFQEVANIASNLVKPGGYLEYAHLAPDNIEKGNGKLLPCRTVEEDKVRSSNHRFYPGQIVYSKIRPNLSKVVVVDFDGLCSADMYPIDSLISSGYLQKYMLSEPFLEQAVKSDTRVAMPKINQVELNAIAVPVPPIEEQHRIVAKVDELMALCDQLKASLATAQATQLNLADTLVEVAIQ
jgi:type I restriction enzyme S subunit